MSAEVIEGDCLEVLRGMGDASVDCCVTSPPYYGLRDYGVDGQIGLEASPSEFVARLVSAFEEVHRVLKPEGTCWVNLGDSYASKPNGSMGNRSTLQVSMAPHAEVRRTNALRKGALPAGLKGKDLIGIPWMVAFALRDAGWYLRQDIIWEKPNPMPESVRDRCTKAHEYLFLLSKSERYYWDAKAIAEPLAASSVARLAQNVAAQAGSARVPGKTNGSMKAAGPRFGGNKYGDDDSENSRTKSGNEWTGSGTGLRNKRSVWRIATQGFKGAHFATFPEKLAEQCILAGCPPGGLVLDPFGGSGTTGAVALKNGRRAVLCELNPEYVEIARARIAAAADDAGASTELRIENCELRKSEGQGIGRRGRNGTDGGQCDLFELLEVAR